MEQRGQTTIDTQTLIALYKDKVSELTHNELVLRAYVSQLEAELAKVQHENQAAAKTPKAK